MEGFGHYLEMGSYAAVIVTALIGGLWKLHSSLKKQFEQNSKQSEDRAIRTHQRIDTLCTRTEAKFDELSKDVRENYIHKEYHTLEMKRIDGEIMALRRLSACGVIAKERE